MLMRQQLLEMANALVSIADLSGDNNAIGEDKNDQETRMLALQVLESYKQALAGPTTDMNNNNTAATTPPPSSSSGGVHGLGMITPAATPQSTPVIAKSPRLLNTADTPAKTSSLSSSSTPTSTPRLSFVSVPNTSSSSTSSPSTFIQPFLSLLQPAADQDNNNKALFYNSPTGSSSIIGHDTHQMSISSLPPAPQHPPTIGSRKNSKDSTSSSGSSNGSKFSRMLRSNSVKNPFINMFGSIKGDTAETTGEGGNEHGSSLKGSVPKKNKNTLKSNRKGSTDSGNSSLSGNGGTVSDERINVSSSSSSFSSSSTPWYKIQQRRRDSRASSVSSISGSGSSTTNVPVSATAPMTRSAPIGREPGLRRFSASFSFHLKAASASIPSSPSPSTTIIPSRSETAISQISSHSRQHQYHQHDHQQQQHQRHHSQHTRHPQQQQQHQFIPPSYFQQSLHNRQQHSPPQQQRHLHLADTRMAGPKAITSTATGSFFDSVSDSDSDEDETTPHSMYRQQLQSPSQSQQLSSSRPLSYPATSASLMGPLTLSSSTSNSPRRIQIDPRTLQNQHQQHRQQHSQQEERSRYEVYDSDEDSDEDTDSEEEDSEDEAHDEEQHHRRQQQHQRQPYTPARVLVSPEPESLAGYIHRFDDAPPPSYHSLVRSGSVSSVATTTTTIMTMAAAQPALNQLLDLLHQFEEHVLSTFKTPAFRVADPSSPSPATFSAGHSRRESWQSRRPQTIRSFAYLLIELEQNGLLYPQRETLFLLTSTLPSSLSFCSSEQEWLAKTGGATLVPQLATAMLSLEQTCRDQAMMDPTRWLDVARSIDSNSNNLGPCTRDRWLVQVQSLSAAQ
ncbi:hypothetical protein BGZ83_002756 [Gryganskiella cystojenkinii]|nr:hypothetical protein BGZ83_002756 [Gryganskiella cystojenkinii]